MAVISLHRLGRKGLPYFRIVVSHVNRPNKAKANLGFYNPVAQNTTKIDIDSYRLWLAKGARPSKAVERLYKAFCKQNYNVSD